MVNQHKRRTYFIRNSAQGKFISRFVIISLLGGTIALAAFNFLAYKKIDASLYSMRLPKISPGGLLWNEMLYTNLFVIAFILIAFAITARGLFNKIHGPLKKMTYDILRMTNGELNFDVVLRQNDEFADIAADLTTMESSLNQRLTAIRDLTASIISQAEAVHKDSDDVAVRANLEKSIADLRQATGSFSL
jgi:methyl-accepting chemotaxis protein